MGLTPVLVLTGYLGAGKTTLLNRILADSHGRRYAVIVNEFGAIGIDHDLILHEGEEIFEMSNGCVCCAVRGDLIRTLRGLLDQGPFDAIVLETSGLADPGPVAQSFFIDPVLQERVELASVTTIVDARHIRPRLADSREAAEQIAFADQIVLNKTDLVDEAEAAAIEAALRRLNPLAPIIRACHADVDLDRLLERRGFNLDHILTLEPHFHDADCHHEHDHGIHSVSLTSQQAMDGERVVAWLESVLAVQGPNILRAKGIIDVKGDDCRWVFHAVHSLLDGDRQRPWRPQEKRWSRLVFIGRHLDAADLEAGFARCVMQL